jgi:hypothetical protein
VAWVDNFISGLGMLVRRVVCHLPVDVLVQAPLVGSVSSRMSTSGEHTMVLSRTNASWLGNSPYSQYRSMTSRAQSGSLTSPRGRKPVITGLISKTGVPSIASKPCTRRVSLETLAIRQTETPSRFGRFRPRCAKMPTFGQSVLPRG